MKIKITRQEIKKKTTTIVNANNVKVVSITLKQETVNRTVFL